MTRAELTEKLLDIKREKGWSWKHICDEIGGMSPVLITGALLGQMKLTKPQAAKAAELFGLSKSEQALLNEVPIPRHADAADRSADLPLLRTGDGQRPGLKALIEEEFGDGIMSAIDFDLQMERQPDPKGDRVKITMSGKFLPYKYYGATGNAQATATRKNRTYGGLILRGCAKSHLASDPITARLFAAMASGSLLSIQQWARLTDGPQNGLPKTRADHAAGHCADRTGDEKARSGARRGANPVGSRASRIATHIRRRKRADRHHKAFAYGYVLHSLAVQRDSR